MSLVGTRPPTVDEWDKYELHHRARLATKPGLTGMWQVSGRSNITDLIYASDIFCFPSITKNEAFGLALAEAMYYEKPAVTFTIPGSGVNYVCLNSENGIEVENRNVEAYAMAIKKLANNEELRKKYGMAGKQRVEENFLSSIFAMNISKEIKNINK